jgi:thymidylate synthase
MTLAVKTFRSLDEIQKWVLHSLLEQGEESSPRGMRTLELYPVAFILNNPRSRCVASANRRWSLPLALGEFCWHISGSNEVRFIEYYAPQWKRFAEEDRVLGSCYGYRIFNQEFLFRSQWDRLVELLRKDRESRRAVLTFADSSLSLSASAKDVACTNTLQFLIRSDRLHAFVSMRSNDAIWGLPYDVFLFSMIQELLACELNLELGTYSHFATSLHIYERHFDLANRIVRERQVPSFEMPRMTGHTELRHFLRLEATQREYDFTGLNSANSLSNYWQELLDVLKWYGQAKRSGGYSRAFKITSTSPYANLLQNLIPSAELCSEESVTAT